MTSRINGSDIRTFFSNHDEGPHTRSNCNCPENPQAAKAFTLDMTKDDIELYWVDPWVHQIVASDMAACKCRVVVDASKKRHGFTPMAITVDSKYIYWFNSTEKSIYYTNKLTKSEIEQVKAFYGYKIVTLDPATQPFPPRQCLFPKAHDLHPTVISNSANSLTLQMPKVGKPKYCHQYNYEMAAIEYTVYYSLKSSNKAIVCDKKTCPYKMTTSSELVLNELTPFTNYSVMLEATNYYAKLHEVAPIVGTPLVLQTAAEGR